MSKEADRIWQLRRAYTTPVVRVYLFKRYKANKMTDYEKGFEDGKMAMKRQIATDPSALFDLAPMISAAISKKMNESGLTDVQKSIVQRALNGEISQSNLFEALKNPSKWQQE